MVLPVQMWQMLEVMRFDDDTITHNFLYICDDDMAHDEVVSR
jgi:hypothetical protein